MGWGIFTHIYQRHFNLNYKNQFWNLIVGHNLNFIVGSGS